MLVAWSGLCYEEAVTADLAWAEALTSITLLEAW